MSDKMKRRKGEPLYDWVERIAPQCVGYNEYSLKEVMHEVAVESYIVGTNTMHEIQKR